MLAYMYRVLNTKFIPIPNFEYEVWDRIIVVTNK